MNHSDLSTFHTLLIILAVFMVVIGALVAHDFFFRRKKVLALENAKKQLEYDKSVLSARLQLREETIRIARKEIHRRIASNLSGVKLTLEAWAKDMDPAESFNVKNAVELLRKSIESCRNIERDFQADVIREEGLLEIIR